MSPIDFGENPNYTVQRVLALCLTATGGISHALSREPGFQLSCCFSSLAQSQGQQRNQVDEGGQWHAASFRSSSAALRRAEAIERQNPMKASDLRCSRALHSPSDLASRRILPGQVAAGRPQLCAIWLKPWHSHSIGQKQRINSAIPTKEADRLTSCAWQGPTMA